jgi:hypothetical protein
LSLIVASLTASLFLGVLLAQPAASSAAQEREIVCTGPLPFSREELREALLPRWHLLGGVSVVRVTAAGGRTFVQVGPVEGQVDLEGRGGEEAARVVAVMALDLAQAGTPFSVSTAPETSVSASVGTAPAPSIKRQHALRAGFLLLSPFDQSGLVAHLEPTLDVGWEFLPGLGAFVTAGYRQASAIDVSSSLVLRELPLRAGVALRRRWLELRAGGIVRPRFVEGPHSYQDLSWGAAVSVVARLALTSKVALVLAGGVDLFRTRTVFAVNNDPALTTPWLGPWVGAGIAWETAL